LAKRFTIGGFSTRTVTRKTQGLTKVIANFRRIQAKRDAAIEQRCGTAIIPRMQPRHGLIKQRPAIGCRGHPAIA
jgi:hypothetical protein